MNWAGKIIIEPGCRLTLQITILLLLQIHGPNLGMCLLIFEKKVSDHEPFILKPQLISMLKDLKVTNAHRSLYSFS